MLWLQWHAPTSACLQVHKHAGNIINIGSKLGLERVAAVPVYSAAKHGLRGWSFNCHEALRTRGVKVTLINPGAAQRVPASLTGDGWPQLVEGCRDRFQSGLGRAHAKDGITSGIGTWRQGNVESRG